MNFYDFSAVMMNSSEIRMDEYKGKVILVVNTASNYGFTPQFKDLEDIYLELKDQGFENLGFPCNQFANQDSGTNGENSHPLYTYLKQQSKSLLGSKTKWNFTKFLIDSNGKVVKRYAPNISPLKIKGDIIALLEH